MKIKKLLAILSAAMLSCCALGGTAFAEETEPVDYSQYQLGDVTMDGVVDVEDAQYALQIYADMMVGQDYIAKGWYTEEQIALGNVDGKTYVTKEGFLVSVDVEDVQLILMYYADKLSQKIGEQAAEEYISEKIRGYFNNPISREIKNEA